MAAVRLQADLNNFADAAREGLRIVCAECGTHVGGLIDIHQFQVAGPGLTLNGAAVPTSKKEETPMSDDAGRPDFAGFVAALRQEAEWVVSLHNPDRTGQAASDARHLKELATSVESLGRRLGHVA